ncbi:DUF3987 domain-containing protein [Streptomyces sp. NPDC089922]|uniref:DUF3987 domain-containing protein n=1 Tax=Streptomyces sp. NPDC089922 TaxID=3155189 RepID=UPI003446A412
MKRPRLFYESNDLALTLWLAEWTDPAVIQLSPEADNALITYQQRVEPQLAARGGALGHIANWAGKLAGAVARLQPCCTSPSTSKAATPSRSPRPPCTRRSRSGSTSPPTPSESSTSWALTPPWAAPAPFWSCCAPRSAARSYGAAHPRRA